MEAQLSLQLASPRKAVYKPRGINDVQLLFKKHFQSLADQYEDKLAIIYSHFRIGCTTEVVEKFILCGDYCEGVARIQCTNPECKFEYFRPFSCKYFYFFPSCSQKRTLLFSEISRLIFAIIERFYTRAAKRPIKTGMVPAYQSSGEFLKFKCRM